MTVGEYTLPDDDSGFTIDARFRENASLSIFSILAKQTEELSRRGVAINETIRRLSATQEALILPIPELPETEKQVRIIEQAALAQHAIGEATKSVTELEKAAVIGRELQHTGRSKA